MITVSIKQLRYFHALSRHKHFGKAADECAVTQPALSMQIKDLEDMLGMSLVIRGKSGITLTPDGVEIARRAEKIIADIQDLGDYAKTRAGLLAGLFRFGVIPTIAPYILPQLLPVLTESFPQLELKLRESTTERITDELVQGRLDAILIALPLVHGDLETRALFEDPFFLVTNSENPSASQSPAKLLEDSQLLLLEEGHCFRDQAISLCADADPKNLSKFGATSLKTLLELVANNQGITLIPKLAARTEITESSNLRLIRFEDPEPSRTIGLAWRKSSPRQNDFKSLGDKIQKLMQSK